jgi:acyl-CoA thioesterase FadM
MPGEKHLSILDVACADLLLRSRMASHLSRNAWYPVVVAKTVRCGESLRPCNSFAVETSILSWDAKAFIVQHKFWRKDACVAEAALRARVLKRTGGSVSPKEVLSAAGVTADSIALPEWIGEWNSQQRD